MSGYRQAALALHGLGDQDRELILAELPSAEQKILRTYLEELKTLGFANAPENVDSIAFEEKGESPLEKIQAASAETIFAILDPEPPGLVAQFLRMQKWPWEKEFLELCVPVRRDVIKAFRNTEIGAELGGQLMRMVAHKLEKMPILKKSPSAYNQLINWLKKWTR